MSVGQQYPVNLLLTHELGGCDYSTNQIQKKVSLNYCFVLWSWEMGAVIVDLDCPDMLVACHPPTGCDIGCMTAWTFCL